MTLRQDSLASTVSTMARERPATPAVCDAFGTTTHARLAQLTDSARSCLEAESTSGSILGIEMTSRAHAVAALLACEAVGCTVLLLPPGLRAAERREVIETSGPSLLLQWEKDTAVTCLTRIPRRRGPPLPAGIIQLTSGSLGPSQLALRTWHAVRVEVGSLMSRLKLTEEEHVLCASSIAHSYGLIGGLLAPLSAGAAVTLASPDLAGHDQVSPTILIGLGRTYISLLRRDDVHQFLRRTRLALSAGAPLPAGLFRTFLTRTGIPIRQDYGTTETGTISLDDGPQVSPLTVGRPLDHIQVRLDRVTGAGDEGGEILIHSDAVAAGYLRSDRLTPCVDADGWYHTRDSGSFNGAVLRLGPRIRPLVDIPGGPVAPAEIEDAISRLPGIREVLVLPLGQGSAAGIRAIVATDLDGEAVRAYCSSVLPARLQPDRLEIVDALPRSPAGKVLQKYLV